MILPHHPDRRRLPRLAHFEQLQAVFDRLNQQLVVSDDYGRSAVRKAALDRISPLQLAGIRPQAIQGFISGSQQHIGAVDFANDR